MAAALELVAQGGEVLDDAVVHDGDRAGAVGVRVGVAVGRRAVGGPAGVADPGVGCARAGRPARPRRGRRGGSTSLPARLVTDSLPSVSTAVPAESYPRYSSLASPSTTTSRADCEPTYPTIPHMGATLMGPGERVDHRRAAHCDHARHLPWRQNAKPLDTGLVRLGSSVMTTAGEGTPSPYVELGREAWRALREGRPLPLTADELEALRGLSDPIDLGEVDGRLPAAGAADRPVRGRPTRGCATPSAPSSASRWRRRRSSSASRAASPWASRRSPGCCATCSPPARSARGWSWSPPTASLPQRVLAERGLMQRKGFPESYDRRALLRFVSEIKAGAAEVVHARCTTR